MNSLAFPTLLPGSAAFGPLGETEAECDERYGEPYAVEDLHPALRKHRYRMGSLDVSVIFLNGRSGQVAVSSPRGLTEDTMRNFMDAMSDGHPWCGSRFNMDGLSATAVIPRSDAIVEAELFRLLLTRFMSATAYTLQTRAALLTRPKNETPAP